jgi:hypothetical protein
MEIKMPSHLKDHSPEPVGFSSMRPDDALYEPIAEQ